MEWTKTLPTSPGMYWWRREHGDELMMRRIDEWPGTDDHLLVTVDHQVSEWRDGVVLLDKLGGEWYGPLQPPM